MIHSLPHRVSLVAHLSCPAPLDPSSVHDSFLPALPFTPSPPGPPSQLPCGPRQGCGRQWPDLKGGRAGWPELTMAKPESRAEVRLEALSLARLK